MAVLGVHTVAEKLDTGLVAERHTVAGAEVHRTGQMEVPVVRHTVLVVVHHTVPVAVHRTVPAEVARHTVQAVVQGVHHTGLAGEAVRPIAVAEEELHTGLEEVALRTD